MTTSGSGTRLLGIKALEPQTFSGEQNQVDNWLFSLELFFQANDLDCNGQDKSKCAAICAALLRGVGLQWYKRITRHSTAPTEYPALKVALVKQFGVIDDTRRARDLLYTLKQNKSVVQYIETFENLVSHIDTITPEEMLHKFMYGLKPAIKQLVLVQNPSNVNEAMNLAVQVEDTHRNYVPQLYNPNNNNSSSRNFAGDESVPMELGQSIRQNRPQQNFRVRGRRGGKQNRRQQVNNQTQGRPQGQNRNQNFNTNRANNQSRNQIKCYLCGGTGHMARECANNRQRQQIISTIQAQQPLPQQNTANTTAQNLVGNPSQQ